MIRYVFKDVLTIPNGKKANPQKIGEELDRIASSNKGKLTPRDVVTAAKNPRNILHKHFDWEDKQAAEKWRLSQAQEIIRCIRVEDERTEDGTARAFISIAEEDGTSY